MTERKKIIDEIINKWLDSINNYIELDSIWQQFDRDSFHKLKNEIYKQYKLPKPIPSIEILERYNERIENWELVENRLFKKILRKRWVRSLSWVTVISLLTKSFGCPGKCIYCPTFEKLPKSYIPNEPAVMRAELNEFDPIKQIHNRLRALEITGHNIEKNDVRIIWGTWSFYPIEYQEKFIKWIYDAFNTYDEMKKYIKKTNLWSQKFASFELREWYELSLSKNIEEAKRINETARCRVIWVAIETRPDWINPEEIFRLRKYWVTRVEIWYQTTIDEINKINKRWHGNKESIEATKLLKNAGFKVVAHMMPNLLWSNPELDKKSLKEVFDNPDFRPDELKIYPMVVTDKSELTDIWKSGWFKAYDDETLIDLTVELEKMIPEYIRLNRTYRDIPSSEILEWSHISNLRQIVEERIKKEGINLVDTRHREIKEKTNDPTKAVLRICEYDASWWKEFFMTFEDPDDRTIFSLLRLRLSSPHPSPLQKGEGISRFSTIKDKRGDEENEKWKMKNWKEENNVEMFLWNIWKECKTKDNDVVKESFRSLHGNPPNPFYQGGIPEVHNSALIREIHTFGDQLSIWEAWSTFGQHIWFGKRLIAEAERISKENWYNKVAVIAWVWVREYYRKRWYELEGEYMVKYI